MYNFAGNVSLDLYGFDLVFRSRFSCTSGFRVLVLLHMGFGCTRLGVSGVNVMQARFGLTVEVGSFGSEVLI